MKVNHLCFQLPKEADASISAAAALAHIFGVFPTLRAPRELWAELLAALGFAAHRKADRRSRPVGRSTATNMITAAALPQPGAREQRAMWESHTSYVTFRVPGSPMALVSIILDAPDIIGITVDFDTSSTFVARCLQSRVYEATNGQLSLFDFAEELRAGDEDPPNIVASPEELARAIIREVDSRDGRPPRETIDSGLLANIQLRAAGWLQGTLGIQPSQLQALEEESLADVKAA